MTPAQARTLVSGPHAFAPVRIEPMLLLGSMPLRRVARVLSTSPGEVIVRLQAVWSWAAAAWSPGSTWGALVPAAVVDLLFDRPGAAAALVRCHVAREEPGVGGVLALRIERMPGDPDITTRHTFRSRGQRGARVRWERHQAGASTTRSRG